jgi:hypothetical protein
MSTVPADQVGQQRTDALVRDVLGLDAGFVHEHFGRQVQDRAVAGRTVVVLAGLAFSSATSSFTFFAGTWSD